jgi:subtilisin-like proprotein convertase family protein
VDYATSTGTATAGSDYVAAAGTLNFAPLATTRTFTVTIINDTVYEGNETVNLTLSGASGATLGAPSSATLTIVEDEAPPVIRLSASSLILGEDKGPAVITVTLSLTGSTTSRAVTSSVSYTTINGTALAGSDYTATGGILSFSPLETSKTITVPITNDTIFEGNETFSLALSSPTHATLGSPSTAVINIANDDPRPGCVIYTRTHASPPLAIPENSPTSVESELVIPLPSQLIGDLSVRIEHLQHTFISDLQIYLVAPTGKTVLIVDKVGEDGDDFIYTVLNDAYLTSINDPSASAPYFGGFRPHDPLFPMYGLASSGTWKLRIVDIASGDGGALHAWGLEVCGGFVYKLHLPLIQR